jgi:hypothetical protein
VAFKNGEKSKFIYEFKKKSVNLFGKFTATKNKEKFMSLKELNFSIVTSD